MENPKAGARAAPSSEATEQRSPYGGRGQELGDRHKNFPFQKQSREAQGWGQASGLSSGKGIAGSVGFPESTETGRRQRKGAAGSTGRRENPGLGETPGDPGSSFPMRL